MQAEQVEKEEPKLQSGQIIISIPSQQAEPDVEDVPPLVEVADINRQNSNFNAEDVMKIFNSMTQEPHLPVKASKSHKSSHKKKHKARPKQHNRIVDFGHLSQKSREGVQRLVKVFRVSFKPSFSDSEVSILRYKSKEKMYQACWYGIEELKMLDQNQRNQTQQKLVKMTELEASNFIKKVIMSIDITFLEILNKNNRLIPSRDLQNQWGFLTSNIKEDRNQQLRRKVLNGSFTPKAMACAKEIDFYTDARREKQIRKEKQYLAQFSATDKPEKPVMETEEVIDTHQMTSMTQRVEEPRTQVPEASHRFVSEETLKFLNEMSSGKHMEKMRKRLASDLTGEIQVRLVNHLKTEG